MRIKNNISLKDTNYFSKIAVDYSIQDEKLRAFIQDFPSIETLNKALLQKKTSKLNRNILHQVILQQYAALNIHEMVRNNIDALLDVNTFTICTAHQPCIFTGPLYFIYKISQAIKLAKECKTYFPQYHFVPIFYMGTEDGDIEEIGTIYVDNKKMQWQTAQTGACGRMSTNDLESITAELKNLLDENDPEQQWLKNLFAIAYEQNNNLADATRILVNGLFELYGLVIIDADAVECKQLFAAVIKDELFEQTSSKIVEKTNKELAKHYKVQAHGRAINLFYIKAGVRERIEKKGTLWQVHNTTISFTEKELLLELEHYMERFSPNVILRPLYQETLLPNIAFIGGGGELAYWLELKAIFDHYGIEYPIIVLRNSFLLIDKKANEWMKQLQLSIEDIFLDIESLCKKVVSKDTHLLNLEIQIAQIEKLFYTIESDAASIDNNLHTSMKAHHAKALRVTQRMRQKYLSQIKRKELDKINSTKKLKNYLFPNNGLQERVDNFISYYKQFGKHLIDTIIHQGKVGETTFIVLEEND